MNTKDRQQAQDYANAMVARINDDELDRALRREKREKLSTIYRAGYMGGVIDAHMALSPRANHMGSILKTIYENLEAMALKYDDLEVLHDLTSMHCLIAGYLVDEGDAILNSTKYRLAQSSGVPVELIDDDKLVTDIPSDVLYGIGLKVANANTNAYAVYVVSGCKEDKEQTMTREGLEDMVRKTGTIPVTKIDVALMQKCLIPYGALQVRRVRRAYREVEKGLSVYKLRHERDATMLSMDLINKAKHGG